MFLQSFINNSEYIGEFIIESDKSIHFNTHLLKSTGQFDRKYFIEMGDVVYAFVINGTLMKIGKAAGAKGWYARMKQYLKGETGDKVNSKIINYVVNNKYSIIKVYAIKTPRALVKVKQPLTGKTIKRLVETAGAVEQELIHEAYKSGELLEFCNETYKG
jgi:hypothetical protein